MKTSATRTLSGWAGSGLFLLAAVLWFYGRKAGDRYAGELAVLRQKQKAIGTDERQLGDRVALAGIKTGAAAGRSANPGPSEAKAAKPPSAAQLLRRDPKIQALYLASKRSSLGATFGPFFRSRGLSADQARQLGDLIMQREERLLDVAAGDSAIFNSLTGDGAINPYAPADFSDGHGGVALKNPSDQTKAGEEFLRQGAESFQAAATALLGADGYQQFQEYERAMPMRRMVNDTAGMLASTASPLSPPQAEQLTQALAEANSGYQGGGYATDSGEADGGSTTAWNAALAQAAAILTPGQLTALELTVARRQGAIQGSREGDRMFRAAAAARAAGNGSSPP